MDLGLTERARRIRTALRGMIDGEIIPLEPEFISEIGRSGNRFEMTARQSAILAALKGRAKASGLWNLWRTDPSDGQGLSTVEYAYLAEEMGRSLLAAEVFNCSAPDTGNMEVLERFGTEDQKSRWLVPLLDGEIRSAFLMTEPGVASSDATNMEMRCERRGSEYVLNGEKWWSSGAGGQNCRLFIVMVRSNDEGGRHGRHSMILVPTATPGIEVLRPMTAFGDDAAPNGHMHIRFNDVRVPVENMLLGEGRGFEIAQKRLGPGRIHHCMRAIGLAELALELMCGRAQNRQAFGKPLVALGANMDIIAEARMQIEMARLLCLKAAWMIDRGDPKAAAPWISQIKVIAPRTALRIVDEAIQVYGAAGLSQDTPLARMWIHLRTLRLVDGPDAVHLQVIARTELKRQSGLGARQ